MKNWFKGSLAAALVIVASLASPAPSLAQGALEFDPTGYHRFLEEFDVYTAGDFTITTTEAGAGSATEAVTSLDGGALLITNDAADNDADFFQLVAEGFRWETGKRLYFEARFAVSDATQSDVVIGLQITDTAPLDVTDGIFFQKDDGDALVDFHVEKNNVATDVTGVATLANATQMTVAFYYDGSSTNIQAFVNGTSVGSAPLTNVPDDEDLTISFGIQNGEAVIKTMTVDYVFAAKER